MAERTGDRVRLTVLGPVRAWLDDEEVRLGGPQVRGLLAILLAQVGRPVGLTEIVDLLWGQDPPATAVNAVHGHVGTLRRLLQPGLGQREHGRWLLRSGGGYQFAGDPDSVDLLEFRRLTGYARARVGAGRDDEALAHFAAALAVRQGRCAANVSAEVRAHPVFHELDRECAAVAREAADCALRAGQPGELVSGVQRAAEHDPLDEALQARLILLLAAAGQQAQALEVYARVRAALADDLGIDPGPELRAAHATVLRQPSASASEPVPVPPGSEPGSAPVPPVTVRPAQLPPDLSTFSGRRGDLRRALALVPEPDADVRTVVISTVSGMAGIGKTTIAVHWAHRVVDRYPDGQLYVNLRGFGAGESVTRPTEALREFLDAFGVPDERIPRSLDGQSALYRSLLAGRRVLVLLDNARDAEQVRPLLPGSPGCLAIVTSRNHLPGLVAADGAHPLMLDVLPPSDAFELLARRVGRHRLDAEPEATAEVLRRSGGLPLALAVVAARVATYPNVALADIADELGDQDGGLDAFADPDQAIDARAVFSWSYRALSPASARLFRLLGDTRTGPSLSLSAAASLAGVPVRQVRPSLTELVRANLVTQPAPGRYGMHDLLAAYAAELAGQTDSRSDRRAAQLRLLDHYLHSTLTADRLFAPGRRPIEVAAPTAGTTLAEPADRDQGLAWLTTERPVLLAAVARAAADGYLTHAWQLTWALMPLLHRRGHWHDWVDVQETAQAALASHADQRLGLAHVASQLGLAYTEFGRYDDAREILNRAVGLFRGLGDHMGQGDALRRLGGIDYKQGRYHESLAHCTDALGHYVAAGDRPGQAHALNSAGWVHILLGDYRQAISYCERSLVIVREAGIRQGEAATLDSLGYAYHHLGEYDRATECYQAAIRLREATGDRVYEANSLHRLGDNQDAAGAHDEARATWQRALTIMSEIGHPDADQVLAKLTAGRPTASG